MMSFSLAVFALATAVSSPFTMDMPAFRYNRDRNPVGQLFHYVKSNIDGTHVDDVYAYVESETKLDVLKLEPGVTTAVNIAATLDWERFMARRLEMYHLVPGNRVFVFSSDFSGSSMRFEAHDLSTLPSQVASNVKSPHDVPIPSLSAHIYGFELLTLNFTMPHLASAQGRFQIGLMGDNPKFGPDDHSPIAWLGNAQLSYEKDEMRARRSCMRYRIDGTAFGDKVGTIWTDSKHGYIVDVEIPLPNNDGWNSFKLELNSVDSVPKADWPKRKRALLTTFFASVKNGEGATK